MAEEGKVEFELVSPEALLVFEDVDMVVVPGSEGDFGVLPRHAPLISRVRTGVIRIYEGRNVKDRIFVAAGFAEVTPERCTVLAEEAIKVDEIDKESVESNLRDLREDAADATSDEERSAIERRIALEEAKLSV